MPDPNIDVVSKTGQIFTIPNTPEDIQQALDKGYQPTIPTPQTLDISPLTQQLEHPETYLANLDQQNAETQAKQQQIEQNKLLLEQGAQTGEISPEIAQQDLSTLGKPEPTVIPSLSDIDLTPDNKVRVISNEGTEYNIPNTEEDRLLAHQKGYKLASEWNSDIEGAQADQAKVDLWKQRLEDSGVAGAIVGAKGFSAGASTEGLTNHIYDYVISKLPYLTSFGSPRYGHIKPEDTPYISQALREITKDHSDIDIGAHGAGLIASVITGSEAGKITGETAKGLLGLEGATSLGGKLAGSAIKNVVENTVIFAPNVAQDLVDRDPAAAAETVLMGSALGMLFDAGGAAVSSAARKFLGREEFQAGAASAYAKALGISNKEFLQAMKKEGFKGTEELLQKVFKFTTPEELAKMSSTERGDFFIKLGKEGGKEIEELNKALDNLKMPEALDMLKKYPEIVGEKFGSYTIDGQAIVDQIKKLAEETTGSAEHTIVRQSIRDVLEKMSKTQAENSERLTFEEAHRLQSLFAKRAAAAKGTEKYFQTAVSDIVRQEREKEISRLLRDHPDIKLEQKLRDANDKYRLSKVFEGNKIKAFNDITPVLDVSRIGHTGIGASIAHQAVGGLMGGLVAPAINSLTGEKLPKGVDTLLGIAVGSVGGRLFRHWMGEKGLLKLSGAVLKQGNSELSKSFIVAGQESLLNKMSKVGPVLGKIGVKAYDVHKEMGKEKPSPIKDFLGDEANGLSKQQQVDRVIKKFSSMTDEKQWNSHKADIMSQFGGFPQLLPFLSQSLDAQKSILQNVIPKRKDPRPFQKEQKQEYSKKEIDDIEDVIRLAQDPFELLHELKEGSITPQKVAVVAAIFPNILNEIKQEMFRSDNKDLTYQQRLFLSVLLQENIDNSQQTVAAIQQAYTNPPTSQGPAKKPANKGSASYATSFQQSVANYLK